ncbi:MAG TPA: transcriptional regulator [Gammaproteobacteria bacterium]|nr:transcriptional regulator [Gammaproteobacteria bacterium]
MSNNDENKGEACHRSRCPVSCLLELIGDKWTLLVVRDLLFDKHTFKELQSSPEKIPTNILADRLKRLEHSGLVRREQYQERPKRYAYHLTEKGQDLNPVMESMILWSNKHIPETYKLEDILNLGSE